MRCVLVLDAKHKPIAGGVTVYLPAKGGVDATVARAKKAGATILAEKIDIGENGTIALVQDTEGNRIGVHADRG